MLVYFFFVRTSIFSAEDERSFFAIRTWDVLKKFLKVLIVEKKFGYKLSCFSVYRRWNKKTAKSILKNVPTTWVYCPFRPQFYSSFLLTERKSEIKMFFTDSQPGYVLRMFLKFCLILARLFLQKFFYKKKG